MENIDERIRLDKGNSNIEFKEHETKRVLGFNIHSKDDCIDINEKDIEFPKRAIHLPPYKAILEYKQKVWPKVNHQIKHIISIDEEKIHRKYLQKMIALIAIPKAYMQRNFMKNPSFWAKFLSLYYNETILVGGKEIKLPSNHIDVYYQRWLILCALLKEFYLPIFQIIQFIYKGRCRLIRSKINNETLLKHNVKALDFMYYIITYDLNEYYAMDLLQYKLLSRLDNVTKKKTITIPHAIPNNFVFY